VLTAGDNGRSSPERRQLKDPKGFIKHSLALHFDPVKESFDVIEFTDDASSSAIPAAARRRRERRPGVVLPRHHRGKRAEAEIAYERTCSRPVGQPADTLYFKDLESRFVRVSRSKVESALVILRDRHRQDHPADPQEAYPAHLQSIAGMREWLAGKTDLDIIPSEAAQSRRAEEQEIIRTGQPLTEKVESTVLPSGKTAWYLVTKMPWRDEHGHIIAPTAFRRHHRHEGGEEQLSAVHQELMQASRQAGMAESPPGCCTTSATC